MPFSSLQLLLGALAAASVAFAAWRARFLKPSGAWATAALGTVVFGLGGIAWSVPLITFFLLSSLLSKYGPKGRIRQREELDLVFEKGSTRDAGQVWANGGIAGLIVLAHALDPDPSLFIAYLGALAAAAADTWGTEIGVLSRGGTVSVRTFRPVPRGTSGGISALGTLGAAAGALSVALSGIGWTGRPLTALAIAVAAGLGGMLADSLVGGTLQARYRCMVCGAITERSRHCGEPAVLTGGYAWVGNDVVNTVCCLVGGMIAYLLAMVAAP